MKVVFVSTYLPESYVNVKLTLYNIYDVDVYGQWYYFADDENKYCLVDKYHFIPLSEVRDSQLDSILND